MKQTDELTVRIDCEHFRRHPHETSDSQNRKEMSGKEVMPLFKRFSVCQYIKKSHGSIRTTGMRYVIDDIDHHFESQKG